MHIFKDIFYALGLTLFFGVIIGFIGVWIFDAEISTMIRVTVYIFILMLAISIYIDYDEMKIQQYYDQLNREEKEKTERMKEEKQKAIKALEEKTTHHTYHPITRTKFSVVISTTRSPNDISIYMNEDYQRALHLMKQINRARSAY